jgi:hypothetical protein
VCEKDEECRKEDQYSLRRKRRKKKLTKAERAKQIENAPYQVVIDFVPVINAIPTNTLKNGNEDNETVAITVHGRDRCLSLFADMVTQIREQLPDQMFLDKMVEKFLTENFPEEKKND